MPHPALDNPAEERLPALDYIDATHVGAHPSLLHSGMSIERFYAMHVQSAVFPVTAGLLFYGWRGMLTLAMVLLGTLLGTMIWRRIGPRGAQLHYPHALWLALLLGLMLPPHLAGSIEGVALWPMAWGAGLALAIFLWLLGGVGSARVHPALLCSLLLVVLFRGELVPHWALQRSTVVVGDLLDAPMDRPFPFRDAWIKAAPIPLQASLYWRQPASQQLLSLTSLGESPDQSTLTLEGLIRDRMPPLEDLIVGGHPGPIGTSSAIAVIIGGLFLLYRGLIDHRIPLLILLTAYAAFLLLPVPVSVIDNTRQWHWFIARQPQVGWAMAITFANYQLLAGPALFMAFFLATAAAIRPMSRRARALYAVLIGLLTALFQLTLSVSFGPYLALFLASLLTPTYDKWFAPRPLV